MGSRGGASRRIYDDIFNRLVGGRYRVKSRLGEGAFGQVFRAEYEVFGIPLRTVALKLFTKGFVTRENAKEVFKEALMLESMVAEARARGEAVHLVAVYDIGVFDDYQFIPYIAMEFLDGGSLEDELRRAGRFPLAQTLRLGRDICAGLRLAHEAPQRIIHRDLKPANVLRSRGGFLKVSDFGVAVERAQAFREGAGGTITYAPPELSRGVPADPGYDVYSLGVTMLEFMLGYNPLARASAKAAEHGQSVEEAIARAQSKLEKLEDPETGRPLSEVCVELAAGATFRRVLACCLSASSSKRYANARALDEALAACQRGDDNGVEPLVTAAEEVKALLNKARWALKRGALSEARQMFREARERDPRNPQVFSGLATVYERLGKLSRACDAQKQGAEYADSRESWNRLADLYEKAGMVGEAMTARDIARIKS